LSWPAVIIAKPIKTKSPIPSAVAINASARPSAFPWITIMVAKTPRMTAIAEARRNKRTASRFCKAGEEVGSNGIEFSFGG
jgi:hypothetical protein